MRIRAAVALILALASPALAQRGAPSRVDRPIVSKYDVDTPTITATTNRIVTSVALTNTSFTIAAQPDTPRNVTLTIVDTTPSITTGTITVTGTDVNAATQAEAFTITAGGTYTGTKIFATVVTTVAVGVSTLGGAGDETITVGVGSTVGYRYCALADPVNAAGSAITSGSSTTVTSANSAFSVLGAGDEITFANVTGQYTRVVGPSPASGTITVDTAVNLAAATVFSYRTLACGYGDSYGWVGLAAGEQSIGIVVRQMTATGGLDYSIQGRQRRGLGLPLWLVSGNLSAARIVGVAPTSASTNTFEIADNVTEVRVGFKFGTTDDSSDTGTEQVDATLTSEVQ